MPKSPSLRLIATAAAAAAAILPLSAAGQALAAPAARPAHPAAAPGPAGGTITLDHGVVLNDGYDAATDASGRTYIGWISNKIGGSAGREVHLCTLPPGARGCKGGVRTITFADGTTASSADALHVFTTPGGKVTLIWMHTTVASENGPQETRSRPPRPKRADRCRRPPTRPPRRASAPCSTPRWRRTARSGSSPRSQ